MKPEILYKVKAQRGDTLRCKGWKQETILRMLENNMENAEAPEYLVVYGGIGKCARNWESYHAIVESLKDLEDDETLVVQSGMPVAIFKTHKYAPSVVMATTNIMKADWPTFYDLQDKNLTIYAQYTAAPWQYIGTQGVIQGTFETLGAIADRHFGGSLAGRILLTAGHGGMGANQPRAMSMHGGVCIDIDVQEEIIDKRIKIGFTDVKAKNLDEAIEMAKKASAEKKALAIGVVGNAATLFWEAYEKGFEPDIVTEMCPCHDPLSYIPEDHSAKEADELRVKDRDLYFQKARESMIKQLKAMNAFHKKENVHVFEYGTSIRKECRDAGMPESEAMFIPGFVVEYIRPLFCEGRGPFRWTCISGEASDLARLDDLVLEMFLEDKLTVKWINLARKHLPIEALPARVCYLGFGERKAFALAVNDLIKKGEVKGPVAFSRDNLDSGSIVNPTFESEKMKDGGDLISDWPMLNGLLNCAAMCDLIAIQANYSMGEAVHTGVTMIADGTEMADFRLEACMTTDSGIGVVRHAQAGYETAREVAEGRGKLTKESIKIPLWWSPNATFGPEGGHQLRRGPHTKED
ncbi:urocanate hydratase [Desulfosarcina sp.]|uniref:urocanate hydratase n=1 Tax=Desulfosarcina sp. TaxID=2027861 RepID=UPI0029BBD661|nr:urocanate hydratase [Desulfosarcina sp.]MDX2453822.1 urocanate hydratase [Desulfosarcina sp.]MDX2491522.1 urocanate hydratase [Desulfosarcina sp.]